MATIKQMGRPVHPIEAVQQNVAVVQSASYAAAAGEAVAAADQSLIDLGGDYVAVPGSLPAKLAEFEDRIAALE